MIFAYLFQIVFRASWGNIIWHLIHVSHSQADKYLILYNSKDNERVTTTVLRCFQEYKEKKSVKEAVIIYSPKYGHVQIPEGVEAMAISRFNLNALCDYYSLCGFPEAVIMCDLTHIKGRDGMDLEGIQGITLEQIVRVGLLDL